MDAYVIVLLFVIMVLQVLQFLGHGQRLSEPEGSERTAEDTDASSEEVATCPLPYSVVEVTEPPSTTQFQLPQLGVGALESLVTVTQQANTLDDLRGKTFEIVLDRDQFFQSGGDGLSWKLQGDEAAPLGALAEWLQGKEETYVLLSQSGDAVGIITQTANLNPLAAVAAAWQLLAVITQKRFLSVIDERLQQIAGGIDRIICWLEDTRAGEIEGNMAYILGQLQLVDAGSLSQRELYAFNYQLESIERQCCQHTAALEVVMQRRMDDFRNLSLSDATKGSADAKEHIIRFRDVARLQLAVLGVQFMAMQAKLTVGEDTRAISSSRLKALEQSLRDQRTLQADFRKLAESRLKTLGLGDWCPRERRITKQREIVTKTLKESALELQQICKRFLAATDRVSNALASEGLQRLDLIVHVDANGKMHVHKNA